MTGKQGFNKGSKGKPGFQPADPLKKSGRNPASSPNKVDASTTTSTAMENSPVDYSIYTKAAATLIETKYRTVPGRYGDWTVNVTEIDHETQEAYLTGQCYALATVLAERDGGRVGLLIRSRNLNVPWGTSIDDEHFNLHGGDWPKQALHALALDGDDTRLSSEAVDIKGGILLADRKADYEARWGEPVTLVTLTPEQMRRINKGNKKWFFKQDYDTATLVSALIEK